MTWACRERDAARGRAGRRALARARGSAVARRPAGAAAATLPRRAAALAARAVVRDPSALPRVGRGRGLSGAALSGAVEPRPPHRRCTPRVSARAWAQRADAERRGLLRLRPRARALRSP